MADRSPATAYPEEMPVPAVPPPGPAASRQPPRFSGSNRYSLFVGLMKVLLPAVAAALILLVIAWPQLSLLEDRFRIGMGQLTLDQADSLTMLNARYDGVDEQRQPYTITADMATQSNSGEDLIDLELPKADMTMEDGAWLALNARAGEYRRDAELLDLNGGVSLFHDRGFELRSEAARIDLKAGTAEGQDPVEGQGAFGTIDAEGFRVLDRGQTIIFTGKSRLILNPEAQRQLQ